VSVHDAQVSHSCRDFQLSGSGNRAKEQHGIRGDTWDSVKMDCFMGVLEILFRQDPLITSMQINHMLGEVGGMGVIIPKASSLTAIGRVKHHCHQYTGDLNGVAAAAAACAWFWWWWLMKHVGVGTRCSGCVCAGGGPCSHGGGDASRVPRGARHPVSNHRSLARGRSSPSSRKRSSLIGHHRGCHRPPLANPDTRHL
jgi:hypothetical protein